MYAAILVQCWHAIIWVKTGMSKRLMLAQPWQPIAWPSREPTLASQDWSFIGPVLVQFMALYWSNVGTPTLAHVWHYKLLPCSGCQRTIIVGTKLAFFVNIGQGSNGIRVCVDKYDLLTITAEITDRLKRSNHPYKHKHIRTNTEDSNGIRVCVDKSDMLTITAEITDRLTRSNHPYKHKHIRTNTEDYRNSFPTRP